MIKYINTNNFQINQALYGYDSKYIDVTLIIKNSIKNNKKIYINNETFKEDPCKGRVKELIIKLNTKTLKFKENITLYFYNEPTTQQIVYQDIILDNIYSDNTECNYILSTNVKDENNIIEWIMYHLIIGFDKILIIDNNSTVLVTDILKNFKFKNKVEVITINKKNNIISSVMNYIVLPYMKKHCKKYFIHLDINEYINLNNKYNNVNELLNTFNNPDILILHSLVFGSNNLIKNNDKYKRLLPVYSYCDVKLSKNFKCFFSRKVNINKFINFEIIDNDILYTNINNIKLKNNSSIFTLSYPVYNNLSDLHAFINNYSIQSKDDYLRRKIYRGNISSNLSVKFNNNILNKHNDIIYDNLNIKYSSHIEKLILKYKIVIGFIILRYVIDLKTNYNWIKCYESIRRFYGKEYPIIIIDDQSDTNYLTEINLVNCKIIKSEFPRRGEILPYYYYLKNNFCDRVIVLHDSMNFENYIDFYNIIDYNNYTKIFSFHNSSYKKDIKQLPYFVSNYLKNSEEILKYHNLNINNLLGCFGVCFIIDYKFLKKVEETYNISNLVNCILNRNNRKTLERLLSCIFCCYQEKTKFRTKISLLGDINKNINDQKLNNKIIINKNFFGR